MPKRYKPSASAICKIGTLAHNRQFTTREVREYGVPNAEKLVAWLKKNKLVGQDKHLYPTRKGWNTIEKACKVRYRRLNPTWD